MCVTDGLGSLDLSGRWESATGLGGFQLRSSAGSPGILRMLSISPRRLMISFFTILPILKFPARSIRTRPRRLLFLGRLELKKFGLRSVIFNGLAANFSWDGARWYARDILLQDRTGTIEAKIAQLADGFHGQLTKYAQSQGLASTPPAEICRGRCAISLLPVPRLSNSRCAGRSSTSINASRPGRFNSSAATLRGSQMDRAQCKLLVKDRAITYQQFTIER